MSRLLSCWCKVLHYLHKNIMICRRKKNTPLRLNPEQTVSSHVDVWVLTFPSLSGQKFHYFVFSPAFSFLFDLCHFSPLNELDVYNACAGHFKYFVSGVFVAVVFVEVRSRTLTVRHSITGTVKSRCMESLCVPIAHCCWPVTSICMPMEAASLLTLARSPGRFWTARPLQSIQPWSIIQSEKIRLVGRFFFVVVFFPVAER